MTFRRTALVLASLCLAATLAPGCGGAKQKRLANADKMQQLGRAKLSEGDAEGAVADLTQASKGDPKNAETRHLLGLAYWNKGTVLQDDSMKMEAEKIILESFKLKGEDVPGDWRNNLGALYVDLRRWSEAVVELQKAMKDPEYRTPERPLNNLCKASLEQNKYAEAVEYCDRALRVQPRFCMALVNRGLALQAQKKIAEAIDSFRKVVETEECEAWPEPYLRLGILLSQQGKKNEAKQQLTKAKQLDPEGPIGKEADQYLRSIGR